MVLCSASAPVVVAQDGLRRVSIDGAIGGGHGWRGGERVERGLIATDFLVAIQLADTRQGFLAGVDAGGYWQMNGDLLCLARVTGGCIPQYPGFDALSVVGGYQWRLAPVLRLRVLVGPGYYTAYFDHNTTTSHSLGLGARTDVAVPLSQFLSATVAARGGWVSRIRGQSYVPGAVVIGLRLGAGE